jgi:hypothetical protein
LLPRIGLCRSAETRIAIGARKEAARVISNMI